MNLNTPEMWTTIKRSAALLEEQGIEYVLMGTAALAAVGQKPREVPDVDFMVDSLPNVPLAPDGVDVGFAPMENHSQGSKPSGSYRYYTSIKDGIGFKVDFCLAENAIEKGFLAMPHKIVDDVRMMTVENAKGIKRWKGRAKDTEFLALLEAYNDEKAKKANAEISTSKNWFE